MSWFKTILLLSVLGMTWAECDRRPMAASHAWPEAAFEPAPAENRDESPNDRQPTSRSAGPRVIADRDEPSHPAGPSIQ
jgi:hypothetical protein